MSARLHGYSRRRNIDEPLLDSLRCGPKAASVHNLTIVVERAVMAPDIAKIDPDRPLDLGLPAWNFSDEVLRWLLHGNSLSPFRKTCSSHFSSVMARALPTSAFLGTYHTIALGKIIDSMKGGPMRDDKHQWQG